jgi:predicted O-linked N-acetylglucosamine transferase (SPINDLY family)
MRTRSWLEQLDRRLFSIHCVHTGELADKATELARSLADSFLQSSDIDAIATDLYKQELDVLIYPGIGMDTNTLKLAALRLAPVQCTSWGHPLTTGMPTVDYFLSSELMEPLDGEAHYTEKLVLLPNLSVWYDPSEPDTGGSSRLIIPGLEQNDVIFLCCQNLLKYLPQHDFVFPAIAGQVKNARFVFIAGHISEQTEKFMKRLDKVFQSYGMNAGDYVSVMPHLGEADFRELNSRTDIFLDSIEWSGCNTVFESLPFNKPIVTLPGSFMRGRHAYGILKMMGMEETIAANVEDYISIAVRLANDRPWRDDISDRISRCKHLVYQDRECIKGLETFLVQVSGRGFSEDYKTV